MSDLVRSLAPWLQRLQDLSQFSIHISNPYGQCCRCGAATAGFTEGVLADDLCQGCAWSIRPNRWEGEFYTNATVLVSHTLMYQSTVRVIWDGEDRSGGTFEKQFGLVVIDGQPYLVSEGYCSSNSHLLDPWTMQVVRAHGLHIGPPLLQKLYATQEPLS